MDTSHATAAQDAAAFSDPHPWRRLYESADDVARGAVADIVNAHASALAERFYTQLLNDPQAAPMLSHELVATHLHGSLQRWMRELFGKPQEEPDIPALIAIQERVGEVHARLKVPVPLVSRGARILKDAINGHLRASTLDREALSWAQQYVGGLFDLALEVMSAAYLRGAQRGVRVDEAYRLFSLGQNVSTERERQRAALTEWVQSVLLDMHAAGADGRTPPLPSARASEFGRWLHHKGSAMFDGAQEFEPLLETMAALDRELLPRIQEALAGQAPLAEAVEAFRAKVADAKFLLMALFDRVAALDGGYDPLTQLLNRRFLPSVLAREMALAASSQGTFSVLLVDVDHFKRINDRYGHGGGDVVLRQVAELLQNICRAGDYVFRYGGEEFLIVLVDADEVAVERVAETIRRRVEATPMQLSGTEISLTVSAGAATYDGHPDPDRLLERADKALYEAKSHGRNRWIMG